MKLRKGRERQEELRPTGCAHFWNLMHGITVGVATPKQHQEEYPIGRGTQPKTVPTPPRVLHRGVSHGTGAQCGPL